MAMMSCSLNLEVMYKVGLNSMGYFLMEMADRPGLLVVSLNLLAYWRRLIGVILDFIVISLKL